MKKIIALLFLSAQLFLVLAQSYTIDLQVGSYSEISFAAFIFANDLSGAPRIFSVTISPESGNIKVRGEVYWKKDTESGYEWLLSFRTKTFQAQSFFNTDLGNTIQLGRGSNDSDLLDENRKRGKPTGSYRIDIYLLNESGSELAFDSETMEFSNPAQTLAILSPQQGSIQNIGGVTAEWTDLTGIEYYQIKANVRTGGNQSLEDALESGDPLIDDAQVGLSTSIDLRTLLSREWLPGQEIVLQVSALPTGGSTSDMIQSDIISFYLEDPANPLSNKVSQGFENLLQSFQNSLGDELLEKLLSGENSITEIEWDDTGLQLTPEEIQQLLEYLRNNPDNLIKVEKD